MVVQDTDILKNNKFVMLSIEMIDAVKNKENTNVLKARYEKLNVDTLAKYLSTEQQKKDLLDQHLQCIHSNSIN